jgi:Cu-processing system ATP-binding protein
MICYQALSKQFGQFLAVDRLSFEVGAGEVVALLGPNGSGKTTALKAAAGLLLPTAGTVLLGRPGLPASTPAARRTISYLPQKVAFPDSLTGLEVLEFYRALRGDASGTVGDALRLASLNGASKRAVGTYSGGMVQRLGLGVAALANAPVMLLDEPTAALDPQGLEAFYGLVETRRREGHTVLFTSHQLGDAERLADRFAVLVAGRLAAVLTQHQLAQRLADRGSLHLRLTADPERALAVAREAAPGARWDGDEMVIPGSAASRPMALAGLQAAGLEVVALRSEEGRLDGLYQELIGAIR